MVEIPILSAQLLWEQQSWSCVCHCRLAEDGGPEETRAAAAGRAGHPGQQAGRAGPGSGRPGERVSCRHVPPRTQRPISRSSWVPLSTAAGNPAGSEPLDLPACVCVRMCAWVCLRACLWPLTPWPPQGRGGGRAPGEDAGAEQRKDGQEGGEVLTAVIVDNTTEKCSRFKKCIITFFLLLFFLICVYFFFFFLLDSLRTFVPVLGYCFRQRLLTDTIPTLIHFYTSCFFLSISFFFLFNLNNSLLHWKRYLYVNMSMWERRDPVSVAAAWRYSTTRIHLGFFFYYYCNFCCFFFRWTFRTLSWKNTSCFDIEVTLWLDCVSF